MHLLGREMTLTVTSLGLNIIPDRGFDETLVANNKFIAVYAEGAFPFTLRMVSIDLSGVAATVDVQIASDAGFGLYQPSITTLGNGNFAVAWTNFSAQPTIQFMVVDAGFVATGISGTIASTANTFPDQVSLVATTGNGFLATWVEEVLGGGFTGQRVLTQAVDSTGALVGTPLQLSGAFVGNRTDVQSDTLANGNHVYTWNSTGEDGAFGTVVMAVVDDSGAIVKSQQVVNNTLSGDQLDAKVAALATGRFVVVWESGSGFGFDVYARLYNADGTPIGNEFQVNTNVPGRQIIPDVVALDDGGFFVAYAATDATVGQDKGWYGQRFDAIGNKVNVETQLLAEPNNASAQFELNSDGRVVGINTDPSDSDVDPSAVLIDTTGIVFDNNNNSYALTDGADSEDALGGNDELFGLAGADDLDGGAGNDLLDGGTDADTLRGGDGNDYFFVENVGDSVIELAGEGDDTIETSISYDMPNFVERIVMAGGGDIGSNGNDLANHITGNSGNNLINGGAGTDLMTGMGGNDTYAVDNSLDQVVEQAAGGIDAIYSSVNLLLAGNVETLILTGTAVQGFGDATNNQIFGNSFVNVLFGQGGNDYLLGLGGDDIFVVTPESGAVDVIGDFEGAGAIGGDRIGIAGFGPGALVFQVSQTSFEIRSADNSIIQQFVLQGHDGTALDSGDYYFA